MAFERQSLVFPQVAQTGDLSSLAQRLGAIRQASQTTFSVVSDIARSQKEAATIAKNAATKAYEGAVSNDILEGVERIKAESFSEAEFNAKITEFRAGVFSDIPPESLQRLTTVFDNIATRSRIGLQAADIEQINQENKVLAEQGISGFRRQATKAAFAGDLETVEFARDNLVNLLDNPSFTPSEIADTIRELDRELDEQQVLGTIDALYTEDPEKALLAISVFQNSKDLDMEPDEQKRITALAYQMVSNRTKLAENIEKIEDDENEARIKKNEEDLSIKARAGELSEVEFIQALRDRDIDANAGDRIRQRMNKPSTVRDNPNVILDIERQFPELSTGELEILLDNAVDDGSLTAATVGRFQRAVITRDEKSEDEQIRITRNLLTGFLKEQNQFSALFDPSKERRLASGLAQYNERTAAGEEPNTVFLDILNQSSEQNELILRTLPALRFGSPDNLDDAETQTTNAFTNNQLTREEANRQLELIETMRALKLRFTK